MATCKDCGYFTPCGERWMCLNCKCRDGDFVRFVNPDDNNDKYFHCFKEVKSDGLY